VSHSDIELNYADDATSMETLVEIVDPTTGEREGFVCDNLTHVMYFLVEHDLRPTREGLREPGRLKVEGDDSPIESEGILQGVRPSDVLNAYRDKNSLPFTLYIEVEGDPALVKEFS